VNLTTQLQLTHKPSPSKASSKKYFIQSQNDLYPVDQFVKFVLPWGIGTSVVYAWHFIATFFCVLLSVVFGWFTRLEERWAEGKSRGVEKLFMSSVDKVEERRMKGGHAGLINGRRAADDVRAAAEGVKERLNNSDVTNAVADGFREGAAAGQEKTKQFGNMQVVT
jgi:hypothetical protein